MHRFFLPLAASQGSQLLLDGREAHHALHVLRLQRGERVTVLDGAGGEFFCEITAATKTTLSLGVLEKKKSPASACPITLFVAVPKGKIIEDIIQKAVELGAQRIVPLLTERVIMHLDDESAEGKREKWQQVATEACKQCGAVWLPQVTAPVNFKSFITQAMLPELTLVGSLQTERRHPRAVMGDFRQKHGRGPKSAGVWIGPEGDFSLAEIRAIEATGAHPITLGELTLRVETAVIYSLSFLNYELRE